LAETHNARQNVVIVVPTVALANEQHERLSRLLEQARSGRYVQTLHESTCIEPVAETVTRTLSQLPAGYGATLIVTTATFLRVVGQLPETTKAGWFVVFDEAFSPWVWKRINYGKDDQTRALSRQCLYTNLAKYKQGTGRRYTLGAAEGRQRQLEAVARGDTEIGGSLQVSSMRNLASEVLNPVTRTEVVEEQESYIEIASVVQPQPFAGFAGVVVMAALLEEHLLHAFWSAEGVRWKRHRPISGYITRDMHTAQGATLRVGHALHPEDGASRRKAQSNAATGTPSQAGTWTADADQVVTRAIHELDGFFPQRVPKKEHSGNDRAPGKSWVLQLNKAMDVSGTPGAVPERALQVPADVRGQDWMGDFQALAAFAVVNPSPAQETWLKQALKLDATQVRHMVRFHFIYQAVGRLLRDPECGYPKTLVTFGREDAVRLHDLFRGSEWLGQVTSLPKYGGRTRGKQRAPRVSEHPEYRATRTRLRSLSNKRNRGAAGPDDLAEEQRLKGRMAEIKAEVAAQ